MRNILMVTALATILAVCLVQPVKADAILHYTLSGVTFSDGGTAIGSFDWDETTGAFTRIDITTTSGSQFNGSIVIGPGCTLCLPGLGSGGTSYNDASRLISPSDTKLEVTTADGHFDLTSITSDLTFYFGESLNNGDSTVGLAIVGGTPVSSEALLATVSSTTGCPSLCGGSPIRVTTSSYGPGTRYLTDGVLTLTGIDLGGSPFVVLPTFATFDDAVAATAVPEPSSLLLLGTGLLSLGLLARHRVRLV